MNDTTIVNSVTPQLTCGVGILRLSGKESFQIIDQLFKPKNQQRYGLKETYTAHYGHIFIDQQVIDEVIVLLMKGPHSFTGEDVVEVQTHGNPFILKTILEGLLKVGCTLSEPGEFTRRAFLNGRLDLSQSEAILDLVAANNKKALGLAMDQLNGSLSLEVHNLLDRTLKVIGFLEASIDFPEDEIETVFTPERLIEETQIIIAAIEKLLKSYQRGKLYKEGIQTILIGAPNVGKSTLLNQLLKEERAIVTHIPGTTRDSIEEKAHLGDLTLNLVDTAGIRTTEDTIEQLGIAKTYDYLKKAQLILFILDSTQPLSNDEETLLEEIKLQNKPYLIIENKVDLTNQKSPIFKDSIRLSAKEGIGLEQLETQIKSLLNINEQEDTLLLTNLRYYELLEKALKAFNQGLQGIQNQYPYDLLSIDYKEAYESLGLITGDTLDSQLLDEIFSKFCIGK